MSLVRNKPTNQSKWIRGMLPPVKGNYLVYFLRNGENISTIYKDLKNQGVYLDRFDYDPSGYTWSKNGSASHYGSKIEVTKELYYDIVWWDEYNYFGEIRKLKIKFPKNEGT